MRLATFLVAILVASVIGTFAFAKGPYGTITVGEWTGGAYTNDNTGAFSHCAASSRYRSGVLVVLAKDLDGDWSLGFASDGLSFTTGVKVQSIWFLTAKP